ncbi:hypothetical protein Cfor_12047 [Coptotermes formosanus]|uniref:Uncharacterized protein n=1 Tax=Coptotermes formosanus TaxID=36987 RepID=A0A6L2PR99_COPFO|nr:hypothetical protein Cfor_12047 [Coptotermes formosanus]
MAQSEGKSPAQNRWRSVSLFGMSANTWRDFYRSGEMSRSREPRNGMSHNITERDIPSGQATTAPPADSRSCGDVLRAMNERNCKAISQCSDNTTSTLLNFLHTQKPHVYDDNTPQQGPK